MLPCDGELPVPKRFNAKMTDTLVKRHYYTS